MSLFPFSFLLKCGEYFDKCVTLFSESAKTSFGQWEYSLSDCLFYSSFNWCLFLLNYLQYTLPPIKAYVCREGLGSPSCSDCFHSVYRIFFYDMLFLAKICSSGVVFVLNKCYVYSVQLSLFCPVLFFFIIVFLALCRQMLSSTLSLEVFQKYFEVALSLFRLTLSKKTFRCIVFSLFGP